MRTKLPIAAGIFAFFVTLCTIGTAVSQPQPTGPAGVSPNPQLTTPAPPATSSSLTVQVERVPIVRVQTAASEPAGFPWSTIWPPLISAIVTLLGTFIALNYSYRNTQASLAASENNTRETIAASLRSQEAGLWQKVNESELKELQNRLDGFYARFEQLTELNRILSSELRSRQKDPATFMMIEKVFDTQWQAALSDGDKALVAEILATGEQIERMILEKSTSVESKLVPYLGRAAAHFRILRLAYNGKLGNDPTNFLRYRYPRQLNAVLDLVLSRIRQRQTKLRSAPDKAPGPMPELAIPNKAEYALPPWVDPPVAPIQT